MNSQLKRFALPIAIVLNVAMNPIHAFAQTLLPDARVKEFLEAYSIKYEIDEDGDFKIRRDLGGGRKQTAYIVSRTSKYQKMEIREIFSLAYSVEGKLPDKVAIKLLQDNRTKKLGAWKVLNSKPTQVVLSTKILAKPTMDEAGAKDLWTSLRYTMVSADRMERELTNGKDKY